MSTRRGVWCAVGAYLIWGVLPVYWKLLQHVPAAQILAHRIVWSFLFLLGVVTARREWGSLRAAAHRRTLLIYAAAALLLTVNWFTYIWAVNDRRIVETSLGYFINPLVSVVLGVVFLRERLRSTQWFAVGVAGVGVAYLTWQYGSVPWVALVLALSFALYGFMKKTAPLRALQGLTLETGLLWLPALGALAWMQAAGTAKFGQAGPAITLLLLGTGVATALPLLLFAIAARSVSLVTVGLLQYIAPTCQLIIGVAVYHEPFDSRRLLGFSLIWAALVLYWLEGVWRMPRQRQA